MMVIHADPAARRTCGEGAIMETLAEADEGLTGTPERLGDRFGLTSGELQACLLELAYAGWIAIRIEPFGRLTIRLAHEGVTEPVTAVPGRSVPAAWRLPR